MSTEFNYTDEELEQHADHKNVILVPEDATAKSQKSYESINTSLLSYSRKWNKEFAKMNKAGDALVEAANGLNAQTANFNNSLYSMFADLNGIIAFIRNNPNWGS